MSLHGTAQVDAKLLVHYLLLHIYKTQIEIQGHYASSQTARPVTMSQLQSSCFEIQWSEHPETQAQLSESCRTALAHYNYNEST